MDIVSAVELGSLVWRAINAYRCNVEKHDFCNVGDYLRGSSLNIACEITKHANRTMVNCTITVQPLQHNTVIRI